MTRMIRGSVLLAACVGLWSCSSDPTADLAGVPFKIVSLPSVVFIQQDSSQLIEFQLIDELDGQIPEIWTLTAASANFTVGLDSTYRPVYDAADGTLTLPDSQTQVRATIRGTALGISNFTATAGGKTLVIPVNVVPGTLRAVFAPANPAPGAVVTMTMPPTLRLTPTSVITFPPNLAPVSLTIAADSMSATFISAPTTDTVGVVTKVFNTEFPTIAPFTLKTQTKLTGAQVGNWTGRLPVTFSSQTPGAAPITATLTAPYAFATSVFSFPTQAAPILNSVSVDSSTANITVGPNVASPLQATRVMFRGAPQFLYTLVSADSVISAIVIPNVPVTLSPTNPRVGDTVTVTAAAGYTFSATSAVTWPLGSTALVAGVAGNVIRVLPMPGSAGVPTITLVTSSAAPLFKLTLPGSAPTPLTMLNTSVYSGRGNPNTATLLTIPPLLTDTLEFYDLVQNIDQFYRMTFAVDSRLVMRMSWPGTADVDMLWCNATCGSFFGGFAGATGANPENGTVTFPVAAPGPTFNLYANVYAGANPSWVKIRIIRTL